MAEIVDQWGHPIKRKELVREVAAPTIGGVRSPITGYPGDGLTPDRLALILREADAGDPIRYLELAETIEERDPHFTGVLGTRRRSVSQLDITIEPADDSQSALDQAEAIRDWVDRDELADELFHILDAIGKGYSHTEIIWDTSEGQWRPERLEYRDPRWFTFARHDLATPMLLDEQGAPTEYPGFKFIFARIQAKSGLALRSGLARLATWNWMFKAYTQRDWAIFTQTYGQPIRLGKYGRDASEDEKDKLFRAVANIAGDCAATIPESMMIEFIESGNVSASVNLYNDRADWLDRQISKAVLGQTSTTDADIGGLGSGKEHREVQKDIETADAKALSAIINRDLIRPWVQLEYGPQKRYPRLKIARPEPEDLKAFADAIGPMIDRGLKVSTAAVYERFGLSKPEDNDEILVCGGMSAPQPPSESTTDHETPPESGVKYPFNTQPNQKGTDTALQAEGASTGRSAALSDLNADLSETAQVEVEAMIDDLQAMVASVSSLEELREVILNAWPDLDTSHLGEVLAAAFAGGELAGRVELDAGA